MARTFSSRPLTLVVQPRPAFGTGSDAGTFSNDVWTPGRDASGNVNAVSWALVPSGRWVTVAGTRLDALDAVVKAAIPGWQDHGNSDWIGVTNAWNGIAIDAANARAWYIAAGGHADSANNGIYRFDAFKMAYAVERLPSNPARWSAGYKAHNGSTFTICDESSTQRGVELAANTWNRLNGWFYDEIYWDNPAVDVGTADVGVPTSRHVYHGVAYLPDRGELVMASRRVWRYSLATGKWTAKNAPGRSSATGGDGGLEEEIILQYDQSRSLLTMVSCGSATPWSGSYDLNSNTWVGYTPPASGWAWNAAAPYRYGDEITVIKTADLQGSDPKPSRYVKYNVTTRETLAGGLMQYSGGISDASFSQGYDGQGMVYIPTLNRYWVTSVMVGLGSQWLEVDPTATGGWSMNRKTFVNTPPVPIACNHAMYVPSLDAVLWLGQADQDIALYRV